MSISCDGRGLAFGACPCCLGGEYQDGMPLAELWLRRKHNHHQYNKVEGMVPANGLETQEI